jgi:hypothetical protein
MIHNIYEKYCNGDSLTDEEVIAGEKHFLQLASLLYYSGTAFVIAAKEVNRTYIGLKDFREARGLKEPK